MEETLSHLTNAVQQGHISVETQENIKKWLNNPQTAEFHDEINDLIAKNDWSALNDAFFTQIEFGTAGIRGRTGLGSARINSWTVGTAAQGLADYLKSQADEACKRGVVIGSDTRLTSPKFVQLVSDIMTSNGIQVFRFQRPPQVGMFSFAVRLKQAQAGVYISASHNPPTDNGLKIYWEDGAQVLPSHDKAITDAVKQVTSVTKDQPNKELITEIGEDFDTVYRTRILHETVSNSRKATVVYSPFHGTGQYGVLPILQEAGFNVIVVDEQMEADGNFPNVPGGVPNPENRESNELTAKKVLETGADLGISTDPDADRLGLVIPRDGSTVILNGNETASLIAYFVCRQLKEEGKLPHNGFPVRTLVTTPLIDAIGAGFDLKTYVTLVGYKFIGEVIRQHEDFGDELFIYGGEESFGALKGSYARDKDASVIALLAAEMVSWLKDQGKTVWDLFDELYAEYGYYHNDVINLKYEGAEGFAQMAKLMDSLRNQPPQQIGEWAITKVTDHKTEPVNGHTSNVLVFSLSEDGKNTVIVRPSGTEPKVKMYVSFFNQEGDKVAAKQQSEQLQTTLKELADQLTK